MMVSVTAMSKKIDGTSIFISYFQMSNFSIDYWWLLYISQTIFPLHPKSPSVDDIPIDDIFPDIFLLIDIFP